MAYGDLYGTTDGITGDEYGGVGLDAGEAYEGTGDDEFLGARKRRRRKPRKPTGGLKYKIRPVKGGYVASMVLPMQGGRSVTVRAKATFKEVRRELEKAGGVGACYEQATVEGFFGSVGNFIKKVTKSKALRKVVKTVGKVVKHPAFSAAVAAIPGVGIPIAGGIQAAVAAERLIRNATKGKKGSRKRIAARTVIKAARAVAKREAKAKRRGKYVPRRRARTRSQRAFRYLIQLQPAA